MPRIALPDSPPPFVGPLVRGDLDWQYNACLDKFGVSWTIYAHGYLEAARILVAYVGEKKKWQDSLVYPVIFLFRQYVELTLKYLIIAAAEMIERDKPPVDSHKLVLLWERLSPLLTAMEPRMNQTVLDHTELDEIRRVLTEFENLDAASHAFRYPQKRDDSPSLPQDLRHLNLRHFRDAMNRLAYLLDRLVGAIDYFHDHYGPGARP